MASNIRKENDIISGNRQKNLLTGRTNEYNTAVSNDYDVWQTGSPTYITYYQLDDMATREDSGLETVHSLVGANSPHKYKKIEDVCVYGVEAMDISTELQERGLLSDISGEFYFLPNSIKPNSGDFFIFDYDGLEEQLFRISKVEFDKIHPRKYYKVQYSIWQDNADIILSNLVSDTNGNSIDYTMVYDNVGGTGTSVIQKKEALTIESAKNLLDGIITRYKKSFYADDIDSFVYKCGSDYYWSPYLQHFLHETNCLNKYGKEILDDVYIMDINEVDNGIVYSEEAYRSSLFFNIEMQNNEIDISSNFLEVATGINEYGDSLDLKATRNLPFFNSPLSYKLITPVKPLVSGASIMLYTDAFSLLVGKPTQLFSDIPDYYKYEELTDANVETKTAAYNYTLKAGDILYTITANDVPTGIYQVYAKEDETNGAYLEVKGITMSTLINETYEDDPSDQVFFTILKQYLNNDLKITETLLTTLNNEYYSQTAKSYILVPLVIYVLKQRIAEVYA